MKNQMNAIVFESMLQLVGQKDFPKATWAVGLLTKFSPKLPYDFYWKARIAAMQKQKKRSLEKFEKSEIIRHVF